MHALLMAADLGTFDCFEAWPNLGRHLQPVHPAIVQCVLSGTLGTSAADQCMSITGKFLFSCDEISKNVDASSDFQAVRALLYGACCSGAVQQVERSNSGLLSGRVERLH